MSTATKAFVAQLAKDYGRLREQNQMLREENQALRRKLNHLIDEKINGQINLPKEKTDEH